MNYKPLDSLKPLAAQLAELIASRNRDQSGIDELFKRMGLSPAGETEERIDLEPTPQPEASPNIGIWRKQEEGGKIVYQRDPAMRESWHRWAHTDVLYPWKTRQRIVLFGESVARGYFYDPHYNPAKELEAILNGLPEGRNLEVIDLAQTSQSFPELLTVARSSVVLDPDMAIFFSGNNWERQLLRLLGDDYYRSIVEAFKEFGLKGVIPLFERKARDMVEELFSTIEDTFIKRGIPVIYIVPEFNLKDWKSDEKENIQAWQPEAQPEKWAELKVEALEAIGVDDMDRLGMVASKMVALCPFNPMGHELLGTFRFLNGDHKQARACFERSRDVVLLSIKYSAPRCFTMIRDQLLQQAGKYGIQIVDLPSIFEEVDPTHIPDRQDFLDYCHLTVEAIKTAMRYTAQKVIGALYGKNIEIDTIPPSGLAPAEHISAIAHFSAAIHNAHHGQPAEILQYHCTKAIQYSSKVKEAMLKYVDFSTRRVSSHLCASYIELLHNDEMVQYDGGAMLMHPPGKKLMDVPLIDTITDTLSPVVPGIRDEIDRLRRSEHGVTAQGIDLLESFYSMTHYYTQIDEEDIGLYQARTTESDFYFVLGKHSDPLLFEISFRMPGVRASKGMIGIRLNDGDHFVATLPVSADWNTHSFRIGEEHLMDGVNKLTINWPIVHRGIPNDLPAAGLSILKVVFPVIGELSSFVARILPVNDPSS